MRLPCVGALEVHLQIPENPERGEQVAKRHAYGIFATVLGVYALQEGVYRIDNATFLRRHLDPESMVTPVSPYHVALPGAKLLRLTARKVFWNLEVHPLTNVRRDATLVQH